MFVVSKPATSLEFGCFASSSNCQSQYNGKIESVAIAQKSIVGFKGSLRRNSSTIYREISNPDICHADATQIEINCSSSAKLAFFLRVEVPTGEIGIIHFSTPGASHTFTPFQTGCGHGVWKFTLCTMENGSEVAHSQVTRNLDGVGILFFHVSEDLKISLNNQEFLHISHYHTRNHWLNHSV